MDPLKYMATYKVSTTGAVSVARYGTTGFTDMTTSAWLPSILSLWLINMDEKWTYELSLRQRRQCTGFGGSGWIFYFLEKIKRTEKTSVLWDETGQPHKQRALPAAKLYKEMLQQYTNVLKVLQSYDRSSDNAEESPLRQWVKQHVNSE